MCILIHANKYVNMNFIFTTALTRNYDMQINRAFRLYTEQALSKYGVIYITTGHKCNGSRDYNFAYLKGLQDTVVSLSAFVFVSKQTKQFTFSVISQFL